MNDIPVLGKVAVERANPEQMRAALAKRYGPGNALGMVLLVTHVQLDALMSTAAAALKGEGVTEVDK